MNKLESLINKAPEIESNLGYRFKDKSLLALAFVHRSFINENRDVNDHNERLEFLGDSVLGVLIAEYLYKKLPHTSEGDLSYLRSRLVEAGACISYTQKLNLENFILLGKGERLNDGRGRDSILSDLFEAIIGAIFIDGGIDAARHFIFQNFTSEIDAIIMTPLQNWKAMLQDYCQKKFQQAPIYSVLSESGPDHNKVFKIVVKINDRELGAGEGPSKKEAQQAAASAAIARLNLKAQE